MREYSRQLAVPVPETATLVDAVWANRDEAPDHACFSRKIGGSWAPVTSREFAAEVRAVAAGLVASGISVGDRVGLMSRTRYEWTVCDYAIWAAGGVTVPLYETSSTEQVAWCLGDSDAVAVFVETAEHERTVEASRTELSRLANVWQLESGGLEAVKRAGAGVADTELEERRRQLTSASTATLIYTSGTTGRPKGCELSHENFLVGAANTTQALGELFDASASTLLFLPLAHVFARIIQVGCVANRVRMGHTADIKNLMPDLQAFEPTFLLSVPRVFEKVYNTAKQKAHADGKGAIFDRAERVAVAYSEGLARGSVNPVVKLQHALFDRFVYAKIRAALGGKVRYAVSGGAPLGERLGHFFRGIGIVVLEGYGLTETTGGATINLPDSVTIGSVGRPTPGTTVRIADDGEVLLKGPNIFRGYWHNETATKEALNPDGFFHTGDIGELDPDGFLRITGRKKEILVTAGGKNVAPAVLEDRLRAHPMVSQCIVVGDQQPFIGCLITIDGDAFTAWKKEHGKDGSATIADLREDSDLHACIEEAVTETNKAVSKAEAIKAFRILPVDFTEEGGQLTPTLKLKRAVVMKEFAGEVAAIYG